MNERELLPCPFCKGAVRFHAEEGECDGCHHIECTNCGAFFDLALAADPENRCTELADLRAVIADLWNRRAALQAAPEQESWSDADINDVTMRVLGGWPSFEAQSWACKVVHAVLREATPPTSATDNREVTLLRAVYEAARRFLRNNGVDRERASAAVDELDDAIERVKNFDGGYDEVDTVWDTTATVEAATIERCAKIAETKARSVLPIKDWSAGFHEAATQIAHAIRALASQPAQPQAEVEVEAERLKQAIINIEGARAVARADFERHPDRKTVVHCWLQDIDVVLEALSTTPQAEAQAGETAEAYKPLTDDECDEFRRLPGSFNDMMRAVHEDGWTRYCGVANEFFGNHYKQKFERALTAQPQAVKWKVVDVRQALPVTDRQDVYPATRYVYKRLYERNEVCGYAWVELPTFDNDALLRALRNGKEEG